MSEPHEKISLIAKDWEHIRTGWKGVLALLILEATAIFAIYNFAINPGLNNTIAAKNATIEEKNSSLDALRAQLGEAHRSITPEGQVDRVTSLEKEVDYLRKHALTDPGPDPFEWPPLTDDQVKEWTSALEDSHVKCIYVLWGQSTEALDFYRSIERVGNKLHFSTQTNEAPSGEPGFIHVSGQASDPAVVAIQALLGKEKIPFRFYDAPSSPEQIGNVVLLIGDYAGVDSSKK